MLPRLAPCYLLPLILYWVALTEAIRCYSCANDFIVWQWRHFFLKRNYGLSTSDSECSHTDFKPDSYQNCHSTCFMFLLNGTNKETGYTKTLGVGRGCSSQFLTDDQHLHLGLGTHSRASEVGEYLPHDFDKLDITEHWCFCATEKCNTYTCFSSPFGSREYANSYIAKRLQYSSYGSGGAGSNGWRYRNTGVGRGCSSQFLTDDQHLHFGLGTHSRASEVGEYLPHDFDKMDITEHWCFCATEKCNIYTCFSSPFGSREYANSYIAKRLQYSSYGSGGAGSNGWRYRNTGPTYTYIHCPIIVPLIVLLICL